MFYLVHFFLYFLLFCHISESWYTASGKHRYSRLNERNRLKRRQNRLNDSPSSNIIPSLEIELATNSEFDQIATFLAYYLYDNEIPVSQRRELARLQLNDLNKRYAERVGRRKFPSVLLKATVNRELVGVVGVDCHYIDIQNKRLIELERAMEGKLSNVVPVIGNLAIARDYRRSGYGKQLVRSCEIFAQEWGFQNLYLLVAGDNIPAQTLYKKCGFKLIYTDETTTAVLSTPTGLKTLPCTKICYGKSFKADKPTPTPSFFSSLQSAFKGIFK